MQNSIRLSVSLAVTLLLSGCFNGFEPAHKELTSSSSTPLSAANVSLTSPAENFSTSSLVRLNGRCTTGIIVNISGDISAIAQNPCANGQFTVDVQLSNGDGPKTIRISQVAPDGKESFVNRTFVRDTMGPALAIITPTANQNLRTNAVMQGSCETGPQVQITENGTAYRVPCNNASFATTLTLNSPDGSVTIGVQQIDLAGNSTSLSVIVRKDTVAPAVTITAPAANANLTSAQATIGGACENGSDVQISGAGVAAPAMDNCTNGAYSIPIVFTTGSGTKAISVSQTDAAGNTGNATRSFNLQTGSAPAITISAPAANTLFQTNLTVSGTCVSGLTVNFSGSGWSSPASTTCANGTFSSAITFSAGDGTKNLIASQTNAQNATGSASRSFMRDGTAPAVTIASPAANSLLRTSVSLMGACESGLPVQISGAGIVTTAAANCSNGVYSASANFSTGDGNKVVTVSQTDAAGNVGTVSRTFIRDSIAPAITIASPAVDTSHATGLTITGACEGTLPVIASGAGVMSNVTRNCTSNAYSIDILFSAGDGSKVVQIAQTDAAGNVGSVSRNFIRTTPAPVIDGPALYATNCAACHGALSNSAKQNRTASQISGAIASIGQMTSLSFLTTAQRQAIADALYVAPTQPAFACDPNLGVGARSVAKGIKRLSRRQYLNTLNDLFTRAFPASTASTLVNTALSGVTLPTDDNTVFSRFDSAVIRQHMKAFFDVSHSLSNSVVNSANYSTFVTAFINLDRGTCTSINTAALSSTCASRFIANFGRRALRRPLVVETGLDEPAIYLSTYNTAGGNAAGINAVVFKFLMAPQFLYQVETDGTQVSGTLHRLSSHAVASRLSYMFWNSMPDETLLQQAATSNLSDANAFGTALNYVADNARAQDSVREFVNEWLQLSHIPHFQTNNASLNFLANGLALDDSLRSAMIGEVEELGGYVYRNNLPFNELFSTNVSFARDSRLMNIYGVSTAAPTDVTPQNAVRFPASQRGGVLTRGALLLGGSELANPIKRGLRVRKEILCLDLGAPPANLPAALDPPAPNPDLTTRQRYDHATSPAVCMECHQHINPMGHGFSAYNSIGRFQTQEPTFTSTGTFSGRYLPIDSQVNLSIALGANVTANTALEFSNLVANHRNTRICVSEKALRFAEGRDPDTAKEGCRLNKLFDHLVQAHSLKDFMKSVAEDAEFRHRLIGN